MIEDSVHMCMVDDDNEQQNEIEPSQELQLEDLEHMQFGNELDVDCKNNDTDEETDDDDDELEIEYFHNDSDSEQQGDNDDMNADRDSSQMITLEAMLSMHMTKGRILIEMKLLRE